MAIGNGVLKLTNSLQLRGGTADDLASVNPELSPREIVVETDTGRTKIGQNLPTSGFQDDTRPSSNHWNNLPYSGGVLGSELQGLEQYIDYGVLHNSIKIDNYISVSKALAGLSSGKFTDMWVGTGIGSSTGRGYRILDFNYFGGNTPHIVVTEYDNFYTGGMVSFESTDNFATGGYYGWTALRDRLAYEVTQAESFFGEGCVMAHSEYLCDGMANGEPSSFNSYTSKCELMTLGQAHGGYFYTFSDLSNKNGYKQFSYYKLSRTSANTVLRDAASANTLWQITPSYNGSELLQYTVGDTIFKSSFSPYLCICAPTETEGD